MSLEMANSSNTSKCIERSEQDAAEKVDRKVFISYDSDDLLIAEMVCHRLEEKGIRYYGGKNSPYIWMQCPKKMKSWEFFDYLLEHLGIVGTPGAGFGAMGEGWFRLTAFASREATAEAVERFRQL